MAPDKDPQPRHETSAPVCFVVVMGQRLLMCIKHGDAPIWRIQDVRRFLHQYAATAQWTS